MAVEEPEYFAFHAGNGVSVSRPEAAVATRQKQPKQRAARSSGGLKPFFQGITLGTVLLIPAGVWYWARMGPVEPVASEPAAAVRPAGKVAKPVYRRKPPIKNAAAPAPGRTGIDEIAPGGVPAALADPPPVLATTPAQEAPLPVVQVPKLAQPDETLIPDNSKPKKNIFHKLAAPFRGKSSNGTEPPAPDGQ